MKNVYLITLILISHAAIAQKFSIRGQVADSTGSALPSATVMLLNEKDSSLVNFGVTNQQGVFELKNIINATYLLKITFVGYKTYSGNIRPLQGQDFLDLGILKMEVAKTKLDEVVIAAEKIPVVVKQDTIEFNASSFKTTKNGNVEELLKKLPGVEVDNEGNVTAQGEQVKRVTVDGKDFFGGRDPKLATRNLPADAINKVQIHNRKSDQALFSGIDDGQREKAINLELKEEKRHGAFGNIAAGYGTDDRYQLKANLNKFEKGSQLSFLGMGNNVNEQGFSMDDYMNFTGGSQQMMGGGRVRVELGQDNQSGVPMNFGNRANGIMKSYAGGLNVNKEISRKTEINGSYFYNYLDHDKSQTTLRENFLTSGRFSYDENSLQNNTNENHRLNLMVDHKIDSANSIRFSTQASYNQTDTDTRTWSRNVAADGTVLNENNSLTVANGNTTNLNSTLLYRHRFPKKGRTISTNLQLGLSQSDRNGTLDATYKYYGANEIEQHIQQRNEQSTDNLSYGTTISYTEPLGGRKYLEANYSFRQNKNDVSRPVYDVTQDEEIFNDSLSSSYRSVYTYNKAGLNLRVNRKKYTATVGAGVQHTNLTGDLTTQGVQIDRSLQNFLPVARFNYDFSNTKHLEFDYETTVQEPTIQQLQPVIDNRDPLNPYQGNPHLRPAYEQSWRIHFGTFDPATFIGFFAFMDVDYTTNAITNAITNENFIRTTTPVNVKDNFSAQAHATISFPITKLKSRVSVTGNYRDQRSINLLDDVAYNITQRVTGGIVRYNYRIGDFFDMNLSAQLNHQLTAYEFDQPDQLFLNHTFAADAMLTMWKNYQLTANLDYLVYENRGTNFSKEIPLLNLSISRFILKNNSGEIKLAVNNLLDKALGVNQTSSVNYIEQTTTNSLGRYFMISFTYALNKQLNPMGMRRGRGGMMHIIR